MTSSSIRENVVSIINRKLDLPETYCKDLEIGIYNWSIEFCKSKNTPQLWENNLFKDAYINKARSIVSNIDPNSYIKNEKLRSRLINDEFKPHEVCFMEPYSLFPEKWRDSLDEK